MAKAIKKKVSKTKSAPAKKVPKVEAPVIEDSESESEQDDASQVDPADSKYLVEAVFLNAGPFKHLISRLSAIFSECPIEFVPPRTAIPVDESDDGSVDDDDESDDETSARNAELPDALINSTEVNDMKFDITGGIRFFTITEDRKVVIKATLNATALHKFHCAEPTKINIKTTPMRHALKIVGDNDILTIRIFKENTDFLYISGKEMRKDTNRVTETRMYLNLPTPDSYPRELCSKAYDYEITIPAVDVQKVCKNMTTGSPDLQIWSDGAGVSFKSQGDAITSASKYSKIDDSGNDDEYALVDDPESDGMGLAEMGSNGRRLCYFGSFDLKNILTFASTARSDTNTIRLYLKQDEPLMIWTSISNIGNMYAMLVPVLKTNVFHQ